MKEEQSKIQVCYKHFRFDNNKTVTLLNKYNYSRQYRSARLLQVYKTFTHNICTANKIPAEITLVLVFFCLHEDYKELAVLFGFQDSSAVRAVRNLQKKIFYILH